MKRVAQTCGGLSRHISYTGRSPTSFLSSSLKRRMRPPNLVNYAFKPPRQRRFHFRSMLEVINYFKFPGKTTLLIASFRLSGHLNARAYLLTCTRLLIPIFFTYFHAVKSHPRSFGFLWFDQIYPLSFAINFDLELRNWNHFEFEMTRYKINNFEIEKNILNSNY